MTKCPNCGWILSSERIKCVKCGYLITPLKKNEIREIIDDMTPNILF